MSSLTRFDGHGQSDMGCIAAKSVTLTQIEPGSSKNDDVHDISQVAGIQGAKRTCELVSLWPPITPIRVVVDLETGPEGDYSQTNAQAIGPAGIEVEALTAVQVNLRTIYDMCKAVDREMTIVPVKLFRKHGEQTGSWTANTGTNHHA